MDRSDPQAMMNANYCCFMCWKNTTDTWSASLSSVTAWQTSTSRSWNSWVKLTLLTYSSLAYSLFPKITQCFSLCLSICLPVYLANGTFEGALEVLQLTLKLLSASAREELRRLLEFMAAAADAANVRLHKEVRSPGACEQFFTTLLSCFHLF